MEIFMGFYRICWRSIRNRPDMYFQFLDLQELTEPIIAMQLGEPMTFPRKDLCSWLFRLSNGAHAMASAEAWLGIGSLVKLELREFGLMTSLKSGGVTPSQANRWHFITKFMFPMQLVVVRWLKPTCVNSSAQEGETWRIAERYPPTWAPFNVQTRHCRDAVMEWQGN